jgi:mono/diheme cytochrome c family protein
MVNQIREGGQEMPAFGTALSQQEIEDLVSFLRAKRKVIVAPTQQAQQSGGSSQLPQTN